MQRRAVISAQSFYFTQLHAQTPEMMHYSPQRKAHVFIDSEQESQQQPCILSAFLTPQHFICLLWKPRCRRCVPEMRWEGEFISGCLEETGLNLGKYKNRTILLTEQHLYMELWDTRISFIPNTFSLKVMNKGFSDITGWHHLCLFLVPVVLLWHSSHLIYLDSGPSFSLALSISFLFAHMV